MKGIGRRWAVATGAVLALAAAAAVLVSLNVHNASGRGVDTAPELLAQHGFGDPANDYSWSMAWFKGKLYVGTSRYEDCVENLTVDYYLVVSDKYKTHPLPGVTCPRNPWNMDLRAEVWQYTPRTGAWRMVYRSPVEPNPRARGKSIARDIAYRGMVVYRGRLYIGDVTADEFDPQLQRKYPPRILSTVDGRHYSEIPARNLVEFTPRGPVRPMGFRSLVVWRKQLYVTITPDLTGQGTVYRVVGPESQRPRFRQVTPTRLAVFEMATFNGSLYLGTGDQKDGYGVWRLSATSRGRVPSRARGHAWHAYRGRVASRARGHDWRAYRGRVSSRARGHAWRAVRTRGHPRIRYRLRPIVTDGAGRGAEITSVVSMQVFRGHLYVGASGWYNPHYQPLSELIRVAKSGAWEVVAGAARTVNGKLKAPISGLGDGFYSAFAAHFWRMADYHGALFVGTNDWSYLVQLSFPGLQPPYLTGVIQAALSTDFGFDIWASCDGRYFFPVTLNAFDPGNMYDFGARSLVPTPAGLFVGSANHALGTKVWDVPISPCQSLVNRPRLATSQFVAAAKTPPTPQGLLTDSQTKGTVVSWDATLGATRYRVLRSADLNVPISLAPPYVLPDGFTLDSEVPNVVAPGTAGAASFNLPVPESFVPVATTHRSYFVDRTTKRGQRYLYRVVALGPLGQQSQPSIMQSAPDPRPKPTFAQVLQAVGPAAAGTVATASVADAGHERASMLRTLALLQRSVGADSDAEDLIERLERQVRYAGLAGGH
ncbi:MAG: hypothetical protein ACXVVQ_07205 [Solirubrobacteraceae bacterium]